jgi:predicted aconitase with swiveling domain
MKEIILKGHKVAKGRARGEALVSKTAISFLGSVNPETGMVVEEGHELNGISIADKILIFPIGKGSQAPINCMNLPIIRKLPRPSLISKRIPS